MFVILKVKNRLILTQKCEKTMFLFLKFKNTFAVFVIQKFKTNVCNSEI